MSQAQRQFAYGVNVCDSIMCPARAAGIESSDPLWETPVVEKYDEQLERSPSDMGVVDESKAKEAWLVMLEYYRNTKQCSEKQGAGGAPSYYDNYIQFAETVAERLDWL